MLTIGFGLGYLVRGQLSEMGYLFPRWEASYDTVHLRSKIAWVLLYRVILFW